MIRRETLGEERTAVVPLCAAGLSVPQRRRIARERIEGALDAERIVASATKQAEAILSRARAAAEATADEAAAEARKSEHAKLSAQYLALHKAEEDRADRELDRGIALGVALAERLIGAALELEPSRIATLARQALVEARGARQAVIEAHERVKLSQCDSRLELELLENPPAPNAKMLKAARELPKGERLASS